MLFRDPIIAICSVCAFVLGMGMFGVILYLPLFMQGVRRIGDAIRQSPDAADDGRGRRQYRRWADGVRTDSTGVALSAGTRRDRDDRVCPDGHRYAALYVAYGMIISGLGMGLLPSRSTRWQCRTSRRAADGRGDLVDDLLSIDRQHGRRRRVRLGHADATTRHSSRRCRHVPSALRIFKPAVAGGCVPRWKPRSAASRAARRCCKHCSTTCERHSSGLHLIFVCSAVIMTLASRCICSRGEPLRADGRAGSRRTKITYGRSRRYQSW
jgi:hypothetical protein